MAVKPLTLLDGTTAYAVDVEAEFLPLYTDIAPDNVQPANKLGTGRFVLETGVGAVGTVPPVGTIVAFYDFNGLVTFNTNFWRYMNGSVIADMASPLNGQTLTDMSGRFLQGFGTDGGGNIGTAVWTVVPEGNANSLINFQHSHTVNNHTHDLSNHVHDMSSHTHTPGSLQFQTLEWTDNAGQWDINAYNIGGGLVSLAIMSQSAGMGLGDTYKSPARVVENYYTSNGSGVTGAAGGNTGVPAPNLSGGATPGTDAQLSPTQDIRPRTVRVRYIIRYK